MPVQPSVSPPRPRSTRSRDFQRLPSTITASTAAPGTLYRRSAGGTSGSTRFGVLVSVVLALAVVVLLVQNTDPVQVRFLGLSGTTPLAVVLLLAVVAVAVVALVIGSLRTAHLRRRLTADPRAARL